MRLKLLLTACLVLTLSTFAAPKECGRCGRRSSVCKTAVAPAPATAIPPVNDGRATLLIDRLLYI
ncbi:MAG TPA: hypothetical protein VHE54_16540 [Puia sp.]|nr:hypothetical protein [Puia sp.]